MSAPVFDHRGDVAAAVLVSAPRFRVSPDHLPVLCDAVRAAADQVTLRLGGHRPAGPRNSANTGNTASSEHFGDPEETARTG